MGFFMVDTAFIKSFLAEYSYAILVGIVTYSIVFTFLMFLGT